MYYILSNPGHNAFLDTSSTVQDGWFGFTNKIVGDQIWKFFKLSDDKTFVNCTLCQGKLKYAGMHNHLKYVHKRNVESKTPGQMKLQVDRYKNICFYGVGGRGC